MTRAHPSRSKETPLLRQATREAELPIRDAVLLAKTRRAHPKSNNSNNSNNNSNRHSLQLTDVVVPRAPSRRTSPLPEDRRAPTLRKRDVVKKLKRLPRKPVRSSTSRLKTKSNAFVKSRRLGSKRKRSVSARTSCSCA
jgi:hypothetical protein